MTTLENEVGRCGYEQFEPDNTDSPITEQQALEGINRIRNSIVGAQNINWSEHIYPLVSLLDRAGYEGLSYPEAKANIGTVLRRIERAEKALTHIAEHARLDFTERGIGEAERYAVLAEDALRVESPADDSERGAE